MCLPAAAYACPRRRICSPRRLGGVFACPRRFFALREKQEQVGVCVCVSITIIIITVILWLKWLESFGFKLGVLRSIGTLHA